MKTLEKIRSLYGDQSFVIELANTCDQAYAVGTGNPGWYSPFGADEPEKVATNLAGLVAVVSGITILGLLEGRDPNDDVTFVSDVLGRIESDTLSGQAKGVFLRLANCTWNMSQPFRDMQFQPLSRVKNMNCFDSLPPDEVAKDWHQIQAAATKLKERLDE